MYGMWEFQAEVSYTWHYEQYHYLYDKYKVEIYRLQKHDNIKWIWLQIYQKI